MSVILPTTSCTLDDRALPGLSSLIQSALPSTEQKPTYHLDLAKIKKVGLEITAMFPPPSEVTNGNHHFSRLTWANYRAISVLRQGVSGWLGQSHLNNYVR